MDYNSSINQKIKSKLVGIYIYCNVNTLAEYVLQKGSEDSNAPFTVDDIENYYSLPEYSGTYANFSGGSDSERDTEVERLKDEIEAHKDGLTDLIWPDLSDEDLDLLAEEIEGLDSLESNPCEIYEWWAVDSWFAKKLSDQGECIVDAGSCHIWGRCTSGQAILLDHSISKIAEEMQILEGQANSWANRHNI